MTILRPIFPAQLFNAFRARFVVAAALACVAALAACTTVDGIGGYSGSGRASLPVPAKLISTMKSKGMRLADPVMIRIFKQESELEVWKRASNGKYALLKTYPMCRWSGQLGPKKTEGDRQAPEGFYHVTKGMLNPESDYFLSFNLGFPNAYDRAHDRTGTALMVHGACTSSGCFALTNDGVGEIYALVRDALDAGQEAVQVQSFPFRMTPQNMAINRGDPNMDFWRNLEEGSDHFEATRQPPKVAVCGRRYVLNAAFEDNAVVSAIDACPPVTIPLAFNEARETLHRTHEQKFAALASDSNQTTVLRFADGGMHPAFQNVLRNKGADALQKRTSGPNAPVSRPKEALLPPKRVNLAQAGVSSHRCPTDENGATPCN